MAGIGGLMSALGGGMAGGAEQTSAMIDAMTGTTVATDTMEENAKLMIRAMIQAARADGEIDAEERAKIFEQLGDLDDAERAFIEERDGCAPGCHGPGSGHVSAVGRTGLCGGADDHAGR